MFIHEAKRRIVSLYSCGKVSLNVYLSVFLALRGYSMRDGTYVHSKLHETCMLNAARKCGPHKHVVGIYCSFSVAPHV